MAMPPKKYYLCSFNHCIGVSHYIHYSHHAQVKITYKNQARAPKVVCIRLGNIHVNPVTSLEIAREFLTKHDAVFATRPITMGIEYVSQGFKSLVVVQWGEHQKKMEKVVAPENKFI